MNSDQQTNDTPGDAPESGKNSDGESLAVQLTLAMAARLGRSGSHQQAEQMLATLPEAQQTSPAVLDLRARLRAQQGDLLDAAMLWRSALQQDPGNGAYRAALDRIEAAHGGGRSRGLLGIAAAVAVVVLALAGWLWLDSRLAQIQDTARANQIAMAGRVEALSDTLGRVDRRQTTLAQRVDDLALAEHTWANQMKTHNEMIDAELATQAGEIAAVRRDVQRLRGALPATDHQPTERLLEQLRSSIEMLIASDSATGDQQAGPAPVDIGEQSDAIANLATTLWRTSASDTDPEATLAAMRQVGVYVQDYTGEPLPADAAQSVVVVRAEPTPGVSASEVKETITPAVYFKGKQLQAARVVVAEPTDEAPVTEDATQTNSDS